MRRWLAMGVLAAFAAAGCGSGKEKPVIPTEIKQPPGMDSDPKAKPARGQKPPDGSNQSSSDG